MHGSESMGEKICAGRAVATSPLPSFGSLVHRIALAILLAMAIVVDSPARALAAASDYTQEQAVAYLNSLVGEYLVGSNGWCNCPDVAKAYYNWLGVGAMQGNGCDYHTGNQPEGWVRVYSDPQPGDVAAWGEDWGSSGVGHVACVVEVDDSSITVVEQSTNKSKATKVKPGVPCYYQTYSINSPYSFLRPNFRDSDPLLPDYDYGSKVTLPEGDGEYIVASVVDPRYVLEVYGGSTDAGANVQLYGTNGTAAQRWKFTANGDGTYTIANAKSDLCLDVDDASMENGANVKQWPWNGDSAQKWWVEDCGDGTYALKAAHSNGFLDAKDAVAANGTNVQQWQGNGNDAQRWLISKCGGSLVEYLPEGDGEYTVASASDPRLFLDVASGSVDNGANVQIYSANGTAAQRWTFTRNDDGTYTIANSKSGLALDVAERSCLDEANVQQWEDGKGLHQKWWIEDCGDGTYCVRSVRSGRCLDIRNGVVSSGSNVQQYRSNGSAAQRWLISKRAGTLTSPPSGDGTYTVSVASEPSLRLDVYAGSVDDGANIQIYEANESDAQRFVFTQNSDGSYLIKNKKSGKLLDVVDMSKADGANVQQWGDQYNTHRAWWLEDLGDGAYAIRAVHSGRCLEVDGGRLVSSGNVQQYRWNGTAAQRWAIERVDEEPPTISDIQVTDLSSEGYTVSCTVADDVGVARVTFPTWTVANGQDDILEGGENNDGYLGTQDGDRWTFHVLASDHNGESGEYLTHVYAWDAAGNRARVGDDETTLVEVPKQGPDLSRDGWVDLGGGKKGYARGGALVTGWLTLDGAKYWFGEDGTAASGWQEIAGQSYYFRTGGDYRMASGWATIDGEKRLFRADGRLGQGWVTLEGSSYYADEGHPREGWQEIDGQRYYFRAAGDWRMASGWATIDGEKVLFRADGRLAQGWVTLNGSKYYADEGHPREGWQSIDGGAERYFRPAPDYRLATGWATVDGEKVQFDSHGRPVEG